MTHQYFLGIELSDWVLTGTDSCTLFNMQSEHEQSNKSKNIMFLHRDEFFFLFHGLPMAGKVTVIHDLVLPTAHQQNQTHHSKYCESGWSCDLLRNYLSHVTSLKD